MVTLYIIDLLDNMDLFIMVPHSLNGNRMTQVGALYLVNSMNTCEKVVAVEVR